SWTSTFAIAFILIGLTYLNHRKCAITWTEHVETLPERPLGLPIAGWLRKSRGWVGWLELFYLAIAFVLLYILHHHQEHPIDMIPDTPLGKGQWLYLIFLWWIVVFNFERAIVHFTPHRLITEGIVTLNAVICSLLIVTLPSNPFVAQSGSIVTWTEQALTIGILGSSILLLVFYGLTYLLYGKEHIPNAGLHIRFGPHATATKAKPKSSQDHP
ncbi:MAG: hypothetical protein QGG64_19460, partial [Candidatus Latescibacteria bacterium]|nr:hypothetical protein [Candidatus Latescibacterota bacterium]